MATPRHPPYPRDAPAHTTTPTTAPRPFGRPVVYHEPRRPMRVHIPERLLWRMPSGTWTATIIEALERYLAESDPLS